jgi:hypothetical protein
LLSDRRRAVKARSRTREGLRDGDPLHCAARFNSLTPDDSARSSSLRTGSRALQRRASAVGLIACAEQATSASRLRANGAQHVSNAGPFGRRPRREVLPVDADVVVFELSRGAARVTHTRELFEPRDTATLKRGSRNPNPTLALVKPGENAVVYRRLTGARRKRRRAPPRPRAYTQWTLAHQTASHKHTCRLKRRTQRNP